MAFTPRYTKPDPNDPYYSTYDRFYWLDVEPYGGNCTGYAYGRFNEVAGRSLYSEFYITHSPADAKYWIYNTWPDQTYTSGTIDLHLGDILVWGSATGFGHVEVVEAINGNTITTSGSIWGSTYGSSMEFYTRTISYPSWNTAMGRIYHNDGGYTDYGNPFIGYIHNKYAEPGPGPTPSENLEISISPSSYAVTMSATQDYVDFTFNITITGIPAGATVSGGNTYPGLSRVYNTGWSYTNYTVSGTTYQRATKTQTLRYNREHSYAYTTTKHMYFNLSFSTGTISTDTPMRISVQMKSSLTNILMIAARRRKKGGIINVGKA